MYLDNLLLCLINYCVLTCGDDNGKQWYGIPHAQLPLLCTVLHSFGTIISTSITCFDSYFCFLFIFSYFPHDVHNKCKYKNIHKSLNYVNTLRLKPIFTFEKYTIPSSHVVYLVLFETIGWMSRVVLCFVCHLITTNQPNSTEMKRRVKRRNFCHIVLMC